MYAIHTSTLAALNASPLRMRRDVSHIPLKDWAAHLKYGKGLEPISPTQLALSFYCLNHVVAEIGRRRSPFEILSGDELASVQQYYDEASEASVRMLSYLLSITVREARHANWAGSSSSHHWKTILKKIPDIDGRREAVHHFYQCVNGSGSSTTMALPYHDHGLDLLTGDVIKACYEIFATKGVWGGAFGGKPWAGITAVLLAFVEGRISAETVVDTAFTLCHNCSPIFNKGMNFSSYDKELALVLDAQAAGEVIPLVRYMQSSHGSFDAHHRAQERASRALVLVEETMLTFKRDPDFLKMSKVESPLDAKMQFSYHQLLKGAPGAEHVTSKPMKPKMKQYQGPVFVVHPGLVLPIEIAERENA